MFVYTGRGPVGVYDFKPPMLPIPPIVFSFNFLFSSLIILFWSSICWFRLEVFDLKSSIFKSLPFNYLSYCYLEFSSSFIYSNNFVIYFCLSAIFYYCIVIIYFESTNLSFFFWYFDCKSSYFFFNFESYISNA